MNPGQGIRPESNSESYLLKQQQQIEAMGKPW